MLVDNRIKFRHLVSFLEVARQRSFAKAADALAVSQPAMSKTLKELEEILDARLFERGKSGVSLTPAGITFLRYAGPCVQALRDGVNTLRGDSQAGGVVRVGVLSTVESQVVPEVVLRLHRKHRALVVSVATGLSAYLLAQLRVGELDLVVGRMTDSPEIRGLTFEHLYSESMALVVRPGHPLLEADLSDLALLGDYPLILPLAGTTIRQYAESFFVQCGIPLPAQRLETLSPVLSRRYVLSSDGLWLAPLDAVRLDLQHGELVELALGVREAGGSIGFCWNSALPLPLAAQWFCDELRQVARELGGGVDT
ncbi:pca operon transcription factor PcaQ [Azotobacter chroococcum]|uniref:pca operon transcription factor PcaQ n=1 Tax=Azotobacter chroococcum TaxID=353 RepID=UPI00103DDFBA|nr:pca operon transcription factor PcaQ [Azotobacter chroococcum]TBW01409.1 pca operon transcription factor PcaQ [Azotobacter chroococcum]TBW33242.1 pca operon transcription factor PcaQ [Azotobacter chroococcum]TKD35029.1 pca operon transcription factor PcaQ [Azotobacter chroococcum]